MLKTYSLKTWVQAQSPPEGASVSMDNPPDGPPHNNITVRLSGGLGLETESALDRPTFLVMCRGASGRIAEDIGWWFDSLWLDIEEPFEMDGYRITGTGRLGGAPTYIGTDDFGRVTRGATYWCRIER